MQDKIKLQETQMLQRHQQEIAQLKTENEDAEPKNQEGEEEGDDQGEDQPEPQISGKTKKNQKKRAKAANKAQQKKEQNKKRIDDAKAMDEAQGPAKSVIETQKLNQKLATMNYQIKEIAADGNCMYGSVIDQLSILRNPNTTSNQSALPGPWPTTDAGVHAIRKAVADHIRNHIDDFFPFLPIDHDAPDTDKEVDTFLNKVANTVEWGGQIELKALSEWLRRQIVVHHYDSDDTIMGEQFTNSKPLHLSYHKHSFTLGEHYNSVVPKQ